MLVMVVLVFLIVYFLSFVVDLCKKFMWLFLIIILFWISYLIWVFLWKVIFGYNGVVNLGLKFIGIIDQLLFFLLYNVNLMVMMLVYVYVFFVILLIFIVLEKIDCLLLEVGWDFGESCLMIFWWVMLFLVMFGVVVVLLIVFILIIGDYVILVLIGGGKILMIVNMIQVQMLDLDNCFMGLVLVVMVMLIVVILLLIFVVLNCCFLKVK